MGERALRGVYVGETLCIETDFSLSMGVRVKGLELPTLVEREADFSGVLKGLERVVDGASARRRFLGGTRGDDIVNVAGQLDHRKNGLSGA